MSSDIGFVIGSGMVRLGIDIVARSHTHTPYGPPSSPLLTASIGGRRVACIARHGEEHTIAPHEVNYRANLWALHQHGVRHCIGLNIVGSVDEALRPGELAVPAQLIDYTWGRESTYGGAGSAVSHVEFAEPFSDRLREQIAAAGAKAECRIVDGGVYGVTQGPRLETVAEIDRLARDGCSMVGMTAMPEAALARELGMDYAICALSVNYAAGRGAGDGDIHAQIELYLAEGMQRMARLLEQLVADLAAP